MQGNTSRWRSTGFHGLAAQILSLLFSTCFNLLLCSIFALLCSMFSLLCFTQSLLCSAVLCCSHWHCSHWQTKKLIGSQNLTPASLQMTCKTETKVLLFLIIIALTSSQKLSQGVMVLDAHWGEWKGRRPSNEHCIEHWALSNDHCMRQVARYRAADERSSPSKFLIPILSCCHSLN